jgi:hypothetical protein
MHLLLVALFSLLWIWAAEVAVMGTGGLVFLSVRRRRRRTEAHAGAAGRTDVDVILEGAALAPTRA